ncbi:MAG: hypothetical protein OEN48_01240 [Betaproteobacteria bacterium]|nr:hypothetical protein [Betaproteobacteria bacterium]
MLALLMLLGIALSVFVYNMIDPAQASARREARTEAALRDVKDALIGWSVARTSPTDGLNARPGELPCPDINPLDGFEDGNCVAGALGRVPWKTLGIPEPKDETGELLWYTIAGPLRIWNTNPNPINSDTQGNLTVYQNSVATSLTTEAVAIVFAPGAALGNQNRDPAAVDTCPTTGTLIARNRCAANYLETAATVNNATLGGPFISTQSSGAFNDKLLVLTSADLMPVVERRVAIELRKLLQDYKANTACACTNLGGTAGCYPYADLSDGFSDAAPFFPGNENNRGRIPALGAAPFDWGTSPCASPVPSIPAWFVNNDWRLVVYYSAGQNFLGPGACVTCVDPTLTVNGVAGSEAVVLTPGPLLSAAPRAPVPTNDPTYWQYYFPNDSANYDLNDIYVTPSATAYARDRIYTIP